MGKLIIAVAIVVLSGILGGCSEGSTSSPDAPAGVFSVLPRDTQTNIARRTAITMTFGSPVDRGVVEQYFRLISAKALVDSICPIPGTHHGTMETAMHDPAMMSHLDAIHGIPGTFSWSSDGMVATFTPDSILLHHTEHMIHIPEPMKRMIEQRVGYLGTLGGGGMRMPDMKFHFTTGL